MLRPRTVFTPLPMLVLSVFLASAQAKTVAQLVAEVKRGNEPALQRLIMMGTAGNAEAQVNLGTLYEQGNGIPKDYAQAVNWYQKAAEQGDAEGQFRLGGMYAEGHGVPKDVVSMAKWYRKAAEQGNSKAQFNLGVLYSNGDGVPKDHAEAANWHKKAAEKGLPIAQYALAWMYANGDGVPTDNVKAFMWWNLAAAQGFIGAKATRNTIGKRMTRAQIAEARKLSRVWKPN